MADSFPNEQEKQAWLVSLRLLTATPKSVKELRDKLTAKGFPEPVIQKTLETLESRGILSDRAFAQNIVARFTQGRPSGNRKISFELKRKGVSAKIQEEVLEGLNPDEETERAREMAQMKWERFARLDPEKRKKRVYDFLIRRGFDFQLVRDILEEIESGSKKQDLPRSL